MARTAEAPPQQGRGAGAALSVEGSRNLRDLGGIACADGRRLRARRVLRCGELSGLSAEGAQQLAALRLARIVDLRTPSERRRAPTTAAALAEVPRWQCTTTTPGIEPQAVIPQCFASPGCTVEVMCGLYRRLPFALAEALAALLETAVAGRAVLFHCAAGKDRTGVAAALLLALLGARRDAILADYVASQRVQALHEAKFVAGAWRDAARATPRGHWLPLLQADPRYLEAMFDAVAARHRSVAHYARDCLGQTIDIDERLREALLEW